MPFTDSARVGKNRKDGDDEAAWVQRFLAKYNMQASVAWPGMGVFNSPSERHTFCPEQRASNAWPGMGVVVVDDAHASSYDPDWWKPSRRTSDAMALTTACAETSSELAFVQRYVAEYDLGNVSGWPGMGVLNVQEARSSSKSSSHSADSSVSTQTPASECGK